MLEVIKWNMYFSCRRRTLKERDFLCNHIQLSLDLSKDLGSSVCAKLVVPISFWPWMRAGIS